MPYQGLPTFLKAPVRDTDRPIGLFGIPFDGATSFRPGTRFAPDALRTVSKMLTDGEHPKFGNEPAHLITDMGDIPLPNSSVDDSLEMITNAIRGSGYVGDSEKRLLCMGGDHTVTLGILRALAPHHEELQILHIDAHCDTWEDHFGVERGHGTWVRNVIDEGLVEASNIFQIGIRSPVSSDIAAWLPEQGGRVMSAREALRTPVEEIIASIRQDCPVYISFDIDALDPAYAPGTGTPEIGGLTPHFALDLLEGLSKHIIVGMDLVEVNPMVDRTEITALAGATMLWTVAAMMGVDLERAARTPGGRG